MGWSCITEKKYFLSFSNDKKLLRDLSNVGNGGARDIKLENTLLDGSRPRPNVKICDFGYSKNEFVDSRPKSVSGTPDYIAPEVLLYDNYDGKRADIWSCGVMLYVMLTGELAAPCSVGHQGCFSVPNLTLLWQSAMLALNSFSARIVIAAVIVAAARMRWRAALLEVAWVRAAQLHRM